MISSDIPDFVIACCMCRVCMYVGEDYKVTCDEHGPHVYCPKCYEE